SPLARHMMKVNSTFQKENGRGPLPYLRMPASGFRSGENQSGSLAMISELFQPGFRFRSVRRVKPSSSAPRIRKSILKLGEHYRCGLPRHPKGAAWIQVKRTKITDDFRRRKPVI